MGFTYTLSEPRGQVRLLAVDTTNPGYLFDDTEIDAFLSLEGGNVRRAAALALETTGTNEVLVQKRIRLLELSTDGPSEATALMARAKALREQADRDDQGADGGGFDIATVIVDPFTAREAAGL